MQNSHTFWCCVVVCTSWHVAVAQQQPTNPMPPAAAGVVTQMDKEILASKKKAVDALEKILKDTTKKGDLVGALAVKQAIDRLNTEILAIAQNKEGRRDVDFLGRWRGQGWSVEVLPDGTVTTSERDVTGTWASNGASIEVKFSNGITHVIERTPDGWVGVFKKDGQKGGDVRYTRLP